MKEIQARRITSAFLPVIFIFVATLGARALGEREVSPSGLSITSQSSISLMQLAELTASDGMPNDALGFALAISGNTVVAGGSQDNAAYVFIKPASGWANMTQVAKLTASDGGFTLGGAVSISDDTIIVGASGETVDHPYQGAVYVFVEPPGGWTDMTETAKLTAFDGTENSLFGHAVSISGNTLVIGSPFAPNGGFAYVFVKPETGWATTSRFNARLTHNGGNWFGWAVAIEGNTLAVGTPEGGSIGQGAAYVFVRPSGGWKGNLAPVAELSSSNGVAYDELGFSVAISGNTVVAGAIETNSTGARPGAAYVFVEPAGGWIDSNETAELTASDGKPGDLFGCAVALAGNTLVVGAYDAAIGSNLGQGAGYVFVKPPTGWATTATFYDKLTNSDGAKYDSFGLRVGVSAATIVVSVPEWPAGAGPGAVYVFGP